MDLVELIRARMQAGGWSLRALARAAGVHPSAISRVLNRRRAPTWRWLARVGPVLGLGPREWALAGLPGPADPDPLAAGLRAAAEVPPDLLVRLQAVYARLKAEVQDRSQAAALARDARRALSALPDGRWRDRLTRLVERLEGGSGPAAVAAGAALRYWLLAEDLLPDDRIPGGFLDDALMVTWAEAEAEREP